MRLGFVSHGGIGSKDGADLTGSLHVADLDGYLAAVDSGTVQNAQRRKRMERDVPDILGKTDFAFVTHAHLDHIGDYPIIHRDDNDADVPPTFATSDTIGASGVSWRDAAQIAETQYEIQLRAAQAKIVQIREAMARVEKYESRGQGVKQIARTSGWDRLELSSDVALGKRYESALATLKAFGVEKGEDGWEERFLPPRPPYGEKEIIRAMRHLSSREIGEEWFELAGKGGKDVVDDFGSLIESAKSRSLKMTGLPDDFGDAIPGKISFRLHDAGHIVGSSSVLFRIESSTGNEKPKHVLFSGDLGSYKWDIHPAGIPTPPTDVELDVAVIEGTYGRTVRESFEKGRQEYEKMLIDRCETHDRIYQSCFGLDRFQNILFRTVDLKERWEIDLPIKVDSPTGVAHIGRYLNSAKKRLKNLSLPESEAIRHALGPDYLKKERRALEKYIEYLDPKNGYYEIVESEEEREFLAKDPSKKIVITTSGMANGGPIVSYLKQCASDIRSVFVFPGFMAERTLGRRLVDISVNEAEATEKRPYVEPEKRIVEIEGMQLLVKAAIENPRFLSGHSDAEDILTYLESVRFTKDGKIVIVHGESDGSCSDLRDFLIEYGYPADMIIVPSLLEKIEIENGEVRRTPVISNDTKTPERRKVPRIPRGTAAPPVPTNAAADTPSAETEELSVTAGEQKISADIRKMVKDLSEWARAILKQYDDYVESLRLEIGKKTNLPSVIALSEGLRRQANIERLKKELSRMNNELRSVRQALERADSLSENEETKDPRKRRRIQSTKRNHAKLSGDSKAILSIKEGDIRALEDEIKEEERLLAENFRGIRDSHDVKKFVLDGERPDISGKMDNPEFKNRVLGRLRAELAEVEEKLAFRKEVIEEVKEEMRENEALQKRLESERMAREAELAHSPEHLASMIQSLRKKIFHLSKPPKGSAETEEQRIRRENTAEELKKTLTDLEAKLQDREGLIRALSEMGITYEGVETCKRLRREFHKVSNRLHSAKERHRLLNERDLPIHREDRDLLSRRKSDLEARLANPVIEMENPHETPESGSAVSITPTVVVTGVRMAIDDALRALKEYEPLQEIRTRTILCVEELRDADSPSEERLKELGKTIEGVRMKTNSDVLNALRKGLEKKFVI